MTEAPPFKIQTRKLGRSGVLVSDLCLGAMTFGTSDKNNWGLPTAVEKESVDILNTYAAYGGNFIDTADVYGDSEEVLGRWLQTVNREDFVIATKVRGRTGTTINDVGLSRKHILANVERSLKRLQTNYIDLYQVHTFDIETPLEETFRTLDDLVRVGKIRYIGISNFTGWQLQKAIDLVNSKGWEPIVCLQPQYNLLCRSTEWDLVKVCQNEGVGIIPWSPLAGGWLTGRVTRESVAAESGSRVEWAEKIGWKATSFSGHANDKNFAIVDTLQQIAKETKRSVAQVALRWLLQKPGVTSPIIGARNVEQLKNNLAATSFTLTDEQMTALDKVSEIESPYPWNQFWNKERELVFKPTPKTT